MHKIDTSTAAVTMPTPGAAGTAGWFRTGDPQTGTVGTVVSADWLNAVQAELSNVITAAGITLSKTAQNQLLSALGTLYGGAGTNAAQGSRTLPGGTIIKWGNGSTATGNGDAVTFPGGAFPNAVTSITVTERNASGWATNGCTVFGTSAPTASGFNVYVRVIAVTGGTTSVAAASSIAYNWIALGY